MFAFSLSSHCHHVLSDFLIYIVLRLPSCWLCYDSKTCVMALFFRHTLVKKKKECCPCAFNICTSFFA